MIHIREYIEDTHATVENHVAKSVIKGVCNILNVKGKIALVKDGLSYANKYWDTGDTTLSKDGIKPIVITCNYGDSYTERALVNSNTEKYTSKPIFKETDNNIYIDTVHIGKEVTLTMEFRTRSGNLAKRIEDQMRLMRLQNTDVLELRMLYKYFMTTLASSVVQHAGKAGIEDYMATHTDSRFTIISTIDGGRSQYGFKVDGILQATITTDVSNKTTYEDGTYVYTLELNYLYEKPTFMDVRYDYIINGLTIPDELIPETDGIRAISDLKDLGWDATNDILHSLYGVMDGGYYIRIPEFDKHKDIQNYSPYTTIFSVLIEKNEDGNLTLFNLGELGDLKLSDQVLALLKTEHLYLLDEHSVFNITLYCGKTKISTEHLTIDENLNIVSDIELTCKGSIRVLVGIVNDTSYLRKADLDRLKEKNVFNSLNSLGYLNRSGDIRNLDFKLDLPDKLAHEYVGCYSDVVVNWIRKV